ncbi:thiamine-phosphate kinase [uncultured Nevskia sp.]|uniref:thiamine-phosphate kinase n=1 Tax=uncultured Nevskia sp. TaxID=228950 RepID=UPI0025EB12F4|nr:thiamine-phosphate kinase [uncultured Nevskia sp.]
MDEFALIRRYFAPLSPAAEGVVLGIGDDAAILAPPVGYELLMTSDTLVAGRHFPLATAPYDIGWKALAVNLSDLAAMGAEPLWFLLALTLPQPDEAWLAGFADGLGTLARRHGISLVGGDTTRGYLSITITAVGSVPASAALRRDGARPGDLVCVTGTLGDAALGLRLNGFESRAPCAQSEHDLPALRARLDRPTPRIEAGLALRGFASAAIDLSDGLAGDLGHVLAASGVGADLRADALPMSEAFSRQAEAGDRLSLQAAGGDDYELCVCLPPDRLAAARAAIAPLPLTVIGTISAELGLRWHAADSTPLNPELHSYQHFDDRRQAP